MPTLLSDPISFAVAGSASVSAGAPVFAHGLGGASDLPIPAAYAVAGGGAALALTFVVLLLAWRHPRFDARTTGRPVPGVQRLVESPAFVGALRILGLVFTGYVAWAAVFGPDLLTNPTFGVVYVWLWIGLVPASLLFGPFFRAVSPARTLHWLLSRAMGTPPGQGLVVLPRRVGYWPAAAGLFAFVWLELVWPESTYLGPVRLWFALYFAVLLVGAALFGDRWLAAADPFEVYSTLVGHLSAWGRRGDGQLVVRSPLQNLDGVRVRPGLTAVVAVLLGSTAFDSFSNSSFWLQFGQSSTANMTVVNTALLAAVCAVVWVSFWLATVSATKHPVLGADGSWSRIHEESPTPTPTQDPVPAGRQGGVLTSTTSARSATASRRVLPDLFAHSLVPIVIGYMVAHYLSFFVETGQQTLLLLSDPMGSGADLLGTGGWQVSYVISSHPTALAVTKVLAIVTGHVLGAIAAHDRALRVLPRRHQLTGQLPLLLVMVAYTYAGLFLLFSA